MNTPTSYSAGYADVIVIGAGHAGCEAALAVARMGYTSLLLTLNLDAVANLPCNPSIGGSAKGQLVREIDALGGAMAVLADRAAIQMRMLNASKGPAVRSSRAQIDRRRYQMLMKSLLESQPRLHLRQGEAVEILTDGANPPCPRAVRLRSGAVYSCQIVILATGTYLGGRIVIGEHRFAGGPDGHFAAYALSRSLRRLGLPLQRFKTGTPPRVNRNQIDLGQFERQDGDADPATFAIDSEASPELEPQLPCYLTWTTPRTAELIRANLHRSPLFSGDIVGVGPRYCPSVEDKFVRFPDKERHQIFLEPMGRTTDEMYIQGLSSSLPEEIQQQLVRSLPGMEHADLMRSAYAIEYDCLDPTCLGPDLQSRAIPGLYGAGQINGTSGYEEAAAQGLLAGINAALSLRGEPPLRIDRAAAYIGVLVDDLVTKGTSEPYRLMTARAEYRLLLRQDNADERLMPLGRQVGLIDDRRWSLFEERYRNIAVEIARCCKTRIKPSAEINHLLDTRGSSALMQSASLAELIRRPELDYDLLAAVDPQRPELSRGERLRVETELKYEGYIRLENERVAAFRKLEERRLPESIDYLSISGLRLEARQKLDRQKPVSIGQASRISGVSPADIQVLLVWLAAHPERHPR